MSEINETIFTRVKSVPVGELFAQGKLTDRYRFEVASVMAWLIQLPAARIASAINSAAKIVTAASSVALVCPCGCFACSRSWFSVGIEENLVTDQR